VFIQRKKKKEGKNFAPSRIRRSQRKKETNLKIFRCNASVGEQGKSVKSDAKFDVKSDVKSDFCILFFCTVLAKSTKVVYSLYRGYFNT